MPEDQRLSVARVLLEELRARMPAAWDALLANVPNRATIQCHPAFQTTPREAPDTREGWIKAMGAVVQYYSSIYVIFTDTDITVVASATTRDSRDTGCFAYEDPRCIDSLLETVLRMMDR